TTRRWRRSPWKSGNDRISLHWIWMRSRTSCDIFIGRPRTSINSMIKGVSVSPGVAIARVYRLDEAMAQQNPTVLDPAALPAEVSRFENAVAAVAAELGTVIERVAREVGEDEAAIFRAHRALVRDPALVGKVTNAILKNGQDA